MIKNSKNEKVVGIILVRSDSRRLPNKCFLDFGNFSMLEHIIRRCFFYNIQPIICTTNLKSDLKIIKLAKKTKVRFFCGSKKNKILRISECCVKYNLKTFHTIDADDPFFCGEEVRRSMKLLVSKSLDIVKPTITSSNGSGIVGYSVRSSIFHEISKRIKKNTDTEMMWNFFNILDRFKIETLPKSKFDCNARLTLDYREDYFFLESLRLLVGNFSSRKTICNTLKKNPDLIKINYFRNKEWKKNQNKNLI